MPASGDRVAQAVRQQQPAAAPTASNRGWLAWNAVARDRSAVSLLHLAEQAPAEVVGALSQLVLFATLGGTIDALVFLAEQERRGLLGDMVGASTANVCVFASP